MRSPFSMILTFALTLALSLPGRAQTPPEGSCVNVSVNVNVSATIPGGRYNPVNTEFSGLSFRKHLCNNTPLTETMCGLPVGGNHGACCTQRA